MPMSRRHKIIFIHIPRTAGESIEKCLDIYGGNPNETFWGVTDGQEVLQHKSAEELKSKLNDDTLWHGSFKFSVVRNPWSKSVSEYHWYLRYGPYCTFKTWASSLRDRIQLNRVINIAEVGHNLPQHSFLFDKDEGLLVDKVLKFEHLEAEFGELLRQRNIKAVLGNDGRTASGGISGDFRTYYDGETIETIESIYRKDLVLFGYDKSHTFG